MVRTFSLFLAILFCLGSTAILEAQEENGAFAAGNGIIIYLHDYFYSLEDPDGKTASILIERKGGADLNWKKVAQVNSPVSEREFTARLEKANEDLPYQVESLKGKASEIWQYAQEWEKGLDNGFPYLIYLPVQIAIGMAYHDMDIQMKTLYTYRITSLDVQGASISTIDFNPTSFPKGIDPEDLHYRGKHSNNNGMTLEFVSMTGDASSVVQIFRKDQLDAEYKRLEAEYSFTEKEGEKIISILDPTAEANMLYQYQLIPMDQFGNPGKVLESPVLGHYDFEKNAPVIIDLHASGSKNQIGSELSWRYENYELVAAVRIMRSTTLDGEYEVVAELPRNAISYIDQTIKPMQKYFYYLQILGPQGEESPRSIRLHAVFEDAANVVAPEIVSAVAMDKGVELSIEIRDINMAGVRIYRSDVDAVDWVVITDVLKSNDGKVFYLDEQVSKRGNFYNYMVEAVSTSHLNSPKSDAVFVNWPGSEESDLLKTGPVGLSYDDNGGSISLYWTDTRNAASFVNYLIYRKADGEEEYSLLIEKPIAFNNYVDKDVSPKVDYEYRIVAISSNGVASEFSSPINVTRSSVPTLSPARLKALQVGLQVRLQWNEVVDNVQGYHLYRYERGTKAKRIAVVNVIEVTEFIDRDVKVGQLYFYFIKSFDIFGQEGASSSEVGIRLR